MASLWTAAATSGKTALSATTSAFLAADNLAQAAEEGTGALLDYARRSRLSAERNAVIEDAKIEASRITRYVKEAVAEEEADHKRLYPEEPFDRTKRAAELRKLFTEALAKLDGQSSQPQLTAVSGEAA